MHHRRLLTCLLVFFLFFLSLPVAHAHRVVVFAWTDGNTVHTASKFPGGNKAVGSKIVVYDGNGEPLLEGKTDDQGNFSFPIPKKSLLRIVLEAGAGHQGEWVLSEAEIASALGEPEPASEPEAAGQPGGASNITVEGPKKSAPSMDSSPGAGISETRIAAIVDRALEKKLQPMMQMLADMQDPGPSINDIFGGIGYILGLFGVAALVASRKQKKSPETQNHAR